MNYIGPNPGQGIQIHEDGVQTGSDDKVQETAEKQPGDGRVLVGRRFTDRNTEYSSVEIYELVFFNNKLTTKEVRMIYSKD